MSSACALKESRWHLPSTLHMDPVLQTFETVGLCGAVRWDLGFRIHSRWLLVAVGESISPCCPCRWWFPLRLPKISGSRSGEKGLLKREFVLTHRCAFKKNETIVK